MKTLVGANSPEPEFDADSATSAYREQYVQRMGEVPVLVRAPILVPLAVRKPMERAADAMNALVEKDSR